MDWKEKIWPWSVIERQRKQIAVLNGVITSLRQRRNQPRDGRGRFAKQTRPTP